MTNHLVMEKQTSTTFEVVSNAILKLKKKRKIDKLLLFIYVLQYIYIYIYNVDRTKAQK